MRNEKSEMAYGKWQTFLPCLLLQSCLLLLLLLLSLYNDAS